jgi:hypothetical protein
VDCCFEGLATSSAFLPKSRCIKFIGHSIPMI